MEDYCYELNYEAAKIARNTAKSYSDKPRFVAGAIGPTNRTGSLSPDVNNPGFRNISFDELKDAYYEQAKGLFDGCVDLFLIETVFDTLNCKAALYAVKTLLEEKDSKKLMSDKNCSVRCAGPSVQAGRCWTVIWPKWCLQRATKASSQALIA